jgi:hypothetical protein
MRLFGLVVALIVIEHFLLANVFQTQAGPFEEEHLSLEH